MQNIIYSALLNINMRACRGVAASWKVGTPTLICLLDINIIKQTLSTNKP